MRTKAKAGLATDIANLRKVLPKVVAAIESEAAQQERERWLGECSCHARAILAEPGDD